MPDLFDIVRRITPPEPREEGDKIPWNEPGFSERMLKEHLTQDHDLASRRAVLIDRHVSWIHDVLLRGKSSKILDLGCGPGLYSERLAKHGHICEGIDYSPASIDYARSRADGDTMRVKYRLEDIRSAEYGSGFDLAMLIFGEFNVFSRADAALILRKARAALRDGGTLLLECHHIGTIRRFGMSRPCWSSAETGLFSPAPHILLEEYHWDGARRVASARYYVIDAATGAVARHAQSVQAYTAEEHRRMLADAGFTDIRRYPSLTGSPDGDHKDFFVLAATAGKCN